MTVFHRDIKIKTPRRELKIRRAAQYFDAISRCFNSEWNAVSNIWYIFSKKTKQRSTRSVTTKNTQFNRKSAVFGLQIGTFQDFSLSACWSKGCAILRSWGWLIIFVVITWCALQGKLPKSRNNKTLILTYDSQSACNFWPPHEVLHSPSHRFSERGLSSFALEHVSQSHTICHTETILPIHSILHHRASLGLERR